MTMSRLAREIPVAEDVCHYAIGLVMGTHPDFEEAPEMTRRFVRYGSSPRGAQAILLAAKVRAILDRRYHVSREDFRAVAPAALRHRVILNFEGQAEGISTDAIIEKVLETAPDTIPVGASS